LQAKHLTLPAQDNAVKSRATWYLIASQSGKRELKVQSDTAEQEYSLSWTQGSLTGMYET